MLRFILLVPLLLATPALAQQSRTNCQEDALGIVHCSTYTNTPAYTPYTSPYTPSPYPQQRRCTSTPGPFGNYTTTCY